jgi:tetratricopeptide (TPR) repeat protein
MDTALACARRAQHAAPDQPRPAFLLCRLLLEQRNPEANAMLGQLDRFPGYAPGWEALGQSLAQPHPAAAHVAFERAAKAYRVAEAAAPGADVAYHLGAVLRRLGDGQGARAALQRATSIDLAHAPAWFTLGLLRQDDGDRAGAIQAFRSALAARPAYHEAAFNLAVALQEIGELEAALDQYATAWRLRPDSFGRIAQALVSPACGRLWLDPAALRKDLAARALAASA